MLVPDPDGRIEGTTYPIDRAPDGAQPAVGLQQRLIERFVSWALGVSIALLRPQPNDVIVVRTGERLPSALIREFNIALRKSGRSNVMILLPIDALVHAEPTKLKGEDRGYRETKTYGTDQVKPKGGEDSRGVHTGVPLLGAVTPHPMSESGDDDPCV